MKAWRLTSVGSKQASHPWEHEVSNIHIPFHLSKEQVLHFDSTHAGSWLREWYESDWVAIVCWQQRSYFFLIGVRCTHCAFKDLHNAEHVSFEVSVFVCFETITTYFIAQSNLTYFLFISTFTCLSDRSFACPSALRPYKLGNCLCVSSSLTSMRIERW